MKRRTESAHELSLHPYQPDGFLLSPYEISLWTIIRVSSLFPPQFLYMLIIRFCTVPLSLAMLIVHEG